MSWPKLAGLLFAALVPLVQARVDDRFGSHRATEEVLYLWSGNAVRKLSPGFEGLMADLYWLRTVQYFGGTRAFGSSRKFEVLEPLIEITVSLDPRLEIAYRYGATFLAEPWPVGAGQPEAGIRILERGAKANPRSWILRQNLGFFTYYYLADANRAARTLLEAAKLPGAPQWFTTLAADILGRGGERATARRMWEALYEQSEEGPLRRNARQHLDYLAALDLVDLVQRQVDEYRHRHERNPESLSALVGDGLLRAVPVDPAGFAFDYDAATGVVGVSAKSRLWRQPVKPQVRT